jgi:hypothetical protein
MRARIVLSAHILCCDKWRRKTGGKGYYDGTCIMMVLEADI